jgi:hypothetical protein
MTSRPSHNAADKSAYDAILRSRVSERFTEAGLCLKQLWLYDKSFHPDDVPADDRRRISSGGRKCLRLLRKIVSRFLGDQSAPTGGSLGYYNPRDLANHLRKCDTAFPHASEIVRRFLKGLNSTVSVQANNECKIDLGEASRICLSAAVRVERLLFNLKNNSHIAPGLESVETGVATMKI